MVKVILHMKSGSLNEDLFREIKSAIQKVVKADTTLYRQNDINVAFYTERDQANNYGIRLKEMFNEVISYEIVD